MIKLKSLLENKQEFIQQINSKYPVAGPEVDGREVLDDVDNTSSISASLYQWITLKGIREIPMDEFADISTKHYSVQGTNWIAELARRIEETKTIMPLIMVVDHEGPYILEGSHRIKALKIIGAKSFPALVVIDTEKL
jgi:hypothetical protein